MTTKELDAQKLPYSWELEKAGLVASVSKHSSAGFDTSVCQDCPYQAYRKQGEYSAWCLKPEHAAELKAAAEVEREQQRAAIMAEASTATPGADVPNADTMPRGSYLQIYEWSRPATCTEACACARQALQTGYQGVPQLIPICTDPARYQRLQQEARDAATAERQATHDAAHTRVLDAVNASRLFNISSRDLAVLVMAALADVDRDVLSAAVTRQTIGVATPPDLPNSWEPAQAREAGIRAVLEALAAIKPDDLVHLAVDALLSDELADRYLSQRQQMTPLVSWYLRDQPSAATDDEDADDEYPRQSDASCEECGQRIEVLSDDDDRALAEQIASGEPVVCGACLDEDEREAAS